MLGDGTPGSSPALSYLSAPPSARPATLRESPTQGVVTSSSAASRSVHRGCSCCCRRQRKGCPESTCEYHQGTGPHLPPHQAHLFPTSWEEGCDLGSPAPCPVLRKALNPCLRSYGPRYLLLWYHCLLSLAHPLLSPVEPEGGKERDGDAVSE